MCFDCFCDHHQGPDDRAYCISVFFVGLLQKCKYSLMHVYGRHNIDTRSPYIAVLLL